MGAVYFTRLELTGTENEDVLATLTRTFATARKPNVRFSCDPTKATTFKEAMAIIFTKDFGDCYAGPEGQPAGDPIPNTYCAGFDASYSWTELMMDWFEYVTPALGEGATLYIWPDEDEYVCTVKNGKFEWAETS